MPSRLADRQIRAAAALAAPTLDVRGPVSEAVAQADALIDRLAGEAPPASGTADRPARTRTRS